jgi:hypothetical protein
VGARLFVGRVGMVRSHELVLGAWGRTKQMQQHTPHPPISKQMQGTRVAGAERPTIFIAAGMPLNPAG